MVNADRIFLVALSHYNKFTMGTLNYHIKTPIIMKKLFLIASMILAFATANFAQTKPAPAKTPKADKTAAAPAKKDGTPDMRYKANKDAAKAAPATTHTKADGTPDKRFKENKTPKKN